MALLALLVGCWGRADLNRPSLVENWQQSAEAIPLVAGAVRESRGTPACTNHISSDRAGGVIILTTRLCLSCKNVGFLLRTMAGGDSIGSRHTRLVVPSADTTAICQFLREEKLVLPTIALGENAFPDVARPLLLAYFELDSAGGVVDSVIAQDGMEVIEHIRARQAPDSEAE